MNKKNKPDLFGFVYSTDQSFNYQHQQDEKVTLLPAEQPLRIRLETKHRGGKTVTVISGFVGTEEDLNTLAKQLKNTCGTGGSSKDGEILIQGDHREKIKLWLHKKGYKQTKGG